MGSAVVAVVVAVAVAVAVAVVAVALAGHFLEQHFFNISSQ